MAAPQQEVGDLLDELDRTLAKTYQTMDSLLSANKPTKGSVDDLASCALEFNYTLHHLHLARQAPTSIITTTAAAARTTTGSDSSFSQQQQQEQRRSSLGAKGLQRYNEQANQLQAIMGDSWEDGDFTPVLPQAVILPTKAAWEDEDLPEDPNAGKTPEQIAAEAERKRKAEELRRAKAAKDAERAALRRSAEEEAELMAKETAEERALRERTAVERSDHAMANELFGGPGQVGGQQPGSRPASSQSLSSTTSSSALGGSKKSSSTVSLLNLNAPGDFASLAKDLAPQFKRAASSKDVTSFISELFARGAKDPVAVEDLNDLIKNLQVLAVEKQRQADANRNKIGQKQMALAAKKREHKATSEKHKELFGDDFDGADPEMDQYYDMEDEFM